MGRHELVTEVSIQATQAQVWAVLVEPSQYSEWLGGVKTVEPKTTLKAGGKLTITSDMGSSKMVAHVRVVEFEPGRRLMWEDESAELDGKPFTMIKDAESEFFLAANGKETRVKASVSFEPNGLAAKMGAGWFLNHKVKPQFEQSMVRLKTLVEKGAKGKK